MKEKRINLSNFPHTRLPRTQLAILKYAAKTTDSSKHDEKIDTYDGCFEEPRKLQSGTLVEYKGVVPDDVRALADMGFLDPLNPDLNPIKDDDTTKSYIITQLGELYLCYIKDVSRKNYLPIVISIISLLFSLANILFQLLSSQQILQVRLLK